MLKTRHAVAVCASVLLCGCQYYSLVPAGQPLQVANAITVTPSIDWSKHADGYAEVWTVDGPELERLTFLAGVEEGDPLIIDPLEARGGSKDKLPHFNAAMNALEIADLVRETFDRSGREQFEYTNMSPAAFGGSKGFRFDFTFVMESGLQKKGLATGVVVDGKLHLALYTGAREYYFDTYKDEVERTLATLKLQEQSG